jgi:hypothetical protein
VGIRRAKKKSRASAPPSKRRIHPAAAWWALLGVKDDARAELIEDVRRGQITLVVGAGVSRPRGIPTWAGLVDLLCRRVFGAAPSRRRSGGAHPFESQSVMELIDQALTPRTRKAQELQTRVRAALERRLASRPVPLVSLRHGAGSTNQLFVTLLREALYEGLLPPPPPRAPDTLALLGRAIRRDILSGRGRVRRIITFNADDLLEREVGSGRGEPSLLWPISRSSHHPRRYPSRTVPIYHLHGFLPARPTRYREAPDMLVFTDLEYWSTLASPTSFVNRTFMHALHDSRCVFIGLSMTDVNIVRWLGLRALEISEDKENQYSDREDMVERSTRQALDRHYWIRPLDDDPTGIATAILARRGVRAVSIDRWGSPDLPALLGAAFGPRR